MTTLSYQSIKTLCQSHTASDLVYPCHEKTVVHGKSYGLSQNGYDVRIRQDLELYPNSFGTWFYNLLPWHKVKRDSFQLASTIEYFNVPHNVKFEVKDKSTWARMGLQAFNTIAEAGWRGFLTLELVNHSRKPIFIPAGTPIVQLVFEWLDQPTENPYKGKYQDQEDRPVEALFETAPARDPRKPRQSTLTTI